MKRKSLTAAAIIVMSFIVMFLTSSNASATSAWCVDHQRLTIVGHSVDTGLGTTGYPYSGSAAMGRGYVATPTGWATMLKNQLHIIDLRNISFNGASTRDFLHPNGREGFGLYDSQMQLGTPEMMLIVLGGNEYLSNAVSLADFSDRLSELTDRVHTETPDSSLVLVIAPDPGSATFANQYGNWATWANTVRDVAVAKTTGLLDMRQVMPAPYTTTGAPFYSADKIHPNDLGNRLINAYMLPSLTTSFCT